MNGNNHLKNYVTGQKGMVASAHPLASKAGARILEKGGNAIDAAITVGSSLSVVEPYMSGVGGVGVCLVYLAAEKRTRALNFSGRCPSNIDVNEITQNQLNEGPLSSLIPGVVSGWSELHQKYGSLQWESLFESSIDYSINGYKLTQLGNHVISESLTKLESSKEASELILNDLFEVPEPGTTIKMPFLGNTLKEISKDRSAFYRGELAETIVDGNNAYGGTFSIEDLHSYQPEWQTPVGINFKGYDVLTTPPNSSGFQILQTLKILEETEFQVPVFQSAENIHVFLKAIKLALQDRIKYSCDPDYHAVPIDRLLSNEYINELINRLKSETFEDTLGSDRPKNEDRGMTTHFAVADQYGNVVSFTQTLGAFFGSGEVAGKTGVFLNNGCTWFSLNSNDCNYISPSKRVQFVLAPTQIFRDGRIHASVGTTGGYGILQTTPQIIYNLLSNGLDVQRAIDAPRFSTRDDSTVILENSFSKQFKNSLCNKGYSIDNDFDDPMGLGAAQAILIGSDGIFHGGADRRRDGIAIGID